MAKNINDITEGEYIKGLYSGYTDPTEWNGTNPECKLCDKEIEQYSDFCEDHQECVICGENDECDCEEEWGNVSACCEAPFYEPGYPDNDICSSCKEHSQSSYDEALEDCNVQYAVDAVRNLTINQINKKKDE